MTNVSIEMLEVLMQTAEAPEPCPYLHDRIATLRFGDGFWVGDVYRALLDAGYRRTGFYVYRPACHGCAECQVIRVPVATFRKSKEQRRIWNRGERTFDVALCAPAYTPEKLSIYQRYLEHQHGDARENDENRYRAFLVEGFLGGRTVEMQLRVDGRLAGLGVLDRVGNALSTVYFYFDPDYARLSPGTFSALYEIELARRWGLRYYYLGHYIETCTSMNYKARFRPCEIKAPEDTVWRLVSR